MAVRKVVQPEFREMKTASNLAGDGHVTGCSAVANEKFDGPHHKDLTGRTLLHSTTVNQWNEGELPTQRRPPILGGVVRVHVQ